jgi:transposase InsO family protein
MGVNRLRALRGYQTPLVGRQARRSDPPITYIRAWQLALPGRRHGSVLAQDRRLVGTTTIHRELVLDAVLMALRRRSPGGASIHSDQGTQYGSDAWRRFCRSNHLDSLLQLISVPLWLPIRTLRTPCLCGLPRETLWLCGSVAKKASPWPLWLCG